LMEWIIQRPVGFSLGPDWHVFAFVFVTTVLAALVAANAPIRAVLSLDLNSTLRRVPDDARGTSRGNKLMGFEIGGAAALLVATIALVRLPARVSNSPPRFDARHVLATNLRAPQPDGGWRAFHDGIGRELAAVDGVRGVAFATAGPVSDGATGLLSVTSNERVDTKHTLPWIEVSPSYFDVFGIRIERGRTFTAADADCAAAVCPAVVSRETARELWNGSDALGRRLTIDATHALQVVGIAADAPSEIAEPVQALMVYTSWRPNARLYQPFLHVDDAGSGVVRRVASMVNDRFAGAVAAPIAVDEQLRLITDAFQRIGEVVGLMAAITAVLAIVGVYGVVALAARRRLKEMGIRLALGARSADVYRAMVGPNARPVIIGLVVGSLFATVMAVESDRILAQVFPVRIVDPVAFVVAGLALACAVTIAMVVPARKATAVDPAIVLRQD
jgi:hypothetical protein